MKKKRFSFLVAVSLLICTAVSTGFSDTTYLLQSESSGLLDAGNIGIRLVAGYESGYIPDLLYGAELSFGLIDWLHIAGSIWAAQFPDQGEFRLSGYDASMRMRIWRGAKMDGLTAYVKFAQNLGDPIIIDYPGTLADIGSVVSPRTDSGIDLIAGIAGCFTHASGFAFLFDAEYSRTDLRFWFPLFNEESSKNRIFANLVPAYFFPGSLMVGLQNRLTYWGERGFMYEMMPQVNWEIISGVMASLGGSIPIVGGGVWKAFTAFTFEIDTDAEFAVIHEGEDIRLRVYFNFLGDKSDLFAPQNPKFGSQNKALLDKVAAFIEKYEGYSIVVEGHTNRAKFNMTFDQEQSKEMLPLARARAAAVREALIHKGFDSSLISTQAYGALRPLADFRDNVNNWKNRRVEILLKKTKSTGGKTK